MEVVTELMPRLSGFRARGTVIRPFQREATRRARRGRAPRAGVRGRVRRGGAQAGVSAPEWALAQEALPAWGWATHPGRPAAPLRRRAAGPAWSRSAPTAAAGQSALRSSPLAAAAPAASLMRPDPLGAASGHSQQGDGARQEEGCRCEGSGGCTRGHVCLGGPPVLAGRGEGLRFASFAPRSSVLQAVAAQRSHRGPEAGPAPEVAFCLVAQGHSAPSSHTESAFLPPR